jgi:hypothetical protein
MFYQTLRLSEKSLRVTPKGKIIAPGPHMRYSARKSRPVEAQFKPTA